MKAIFLPPPSPLSSTVLSFAIYLPSATLFIPSACGLRRRTELSVCCAWGARGRIVVGAWKASTLLKEEEGNERSCLFVSFEERPGGGKHAS